MSEGTDSEAPAVVVVELDACPPRCHLAWAKVKTPCKGMFYI